MASEIEKKSPAELSVVGPELRLLDRRAFVGFPALSLSPGLVISDFALQIPEVSFPFNFTGGAARYQKKRLNFGFLELSVDSEVVARQISALASEVAELEDLRLHFRPGYLEGQARLRSAERAALTFKIAFDGDADRLSLYVYDVRFYGFSPVAAPQIPVLLARTIEGMNLLPEVELRGATGFSTRILPPLVQFAAVSRGYKMPMLDQARLAAADVSSTGLRLRFAAGGLPPPSPPDEELLLALEGARAFADPESLIAQGKLKEARDAYLRLGDVHEAHPFAAERLLTLLVADPQTHEMALDIAASIARRRERSAVALWAEAVVRERRGEFARAAERYLALCALARRNQEEAAAFFAAESAARAARDHAPQMAVKALHELLGLKPDHLPSLKQLARASDHARDRAGAIRAYRRIAALARDPADAAEAHVQMARLSAQTEDDVAGARLHCEAALRLSPDHPDALFLLGELCFRADEHLRAIKALDRLREVALGRHEVDRVGKANLLAGKVWELGLKQPENALLRYREAISLLPGEPEPLFYSARVADGLGKLQEALAGYQQAVELAGPAPRTEEIRFAAHQSHHALARLYRTRLGDPAKAREHLEAALALDARDMVALEELIPFFRAAGRVADLAEACEKAAVVTEAPAKRAAFWAEAGELYRGRLGKPEKAEKLLLSALEADGNNRVALEGMLALAESRRDGAMLCRCLKSLAEIAQEKADRARYYRRLAVAARDLAFDLELASLALGEVLKLEPDDLPALGELCGIQRKRSDMPGLASALDQRAKVAEQHGDKRLAAAALRELAQVLEIRLGRVGEALVALERAARLSPDPAVLMDLADLSLRCERPGHARRALEDLLAALPRHAAPERMAEARLRLGKACDALGDREAAKDNFAQAFPLRRLDDELAARLEALYEEDGQTRELTDLWAARAQALVAADRSADAAPLFLAAARALLEAGERDAAILRLTSALDASPDGVHAGDTLELMAELELGRGQKLEAAKLFARRAALLSEPRPAARLFFRAAKLAQGTSRETTFLEQALTKDTTFAPARIRQSELICDADPRGALDHLEAALNTAPNDADAPPEPDRLELTRRAALVAIKAGRTDTARRHLALYTARKPDDLEAQRELAGLHRRAGAREPLCDLLGELWPRLQGPERKAALREHAQLCETLSRHSAGLEALRSLREEDPSDLWAVRALLSQLPADDTGTPVELDERFALVSALLNSSEGEARAELLARRAHLLRRLGRHSEARADLTEAAKLSNAPAHLLVELAEAAREAGDELGELAAWKTAVAREASLADRAGPRVLAIARSRLTAQDYRNAREGFLTATALPLQDDERGEALHGLADAAFALNDVDAALAALLEASRQGSASRRVQALLRRAATLEERNDAKAAIESYEEARRISPRELTATTGLRRLLRTEAQWAPLAKLLREEAAGMGGVEAARAWEELAELQLQQLNDKGAAEEAYRRAASLDRNNVSARRQLAGLLSARGDVAKASALYEETAEILPAAEGAKLLREGAGQALKAGERQGALRLARRAHGLEPATGQALAELAELLFMSGALQEAMPLQERLAEQVSFDRDADAAEQVLLRLGDLAEQTDAPTIAEETYRRVLEARPTSTRAAERLAAIVEPRSPREALQILARHAQQLAPSATTSAQLVHLAKRAQDQLVDTDLAAQLFQKAILGASNALQVRQQLASLYRDTGRTQQLAAQLLSIAKASLEVDDVETALAAYIEEAALAEQSGRVDDAVTTLASVRDLCEERGELPLAAEAERRRAELLRDAKLDLDGADAALHKSFELDPQRATALFGLSLAKQRHDAAGEADWIERLLDIEKEPRARARSFFELAQLQRGSLNALAQAEAAAREALKLDPSLAQAQQLLTELLTAEGRFDELAAQQEEFAALATDPAQRAALYKRAAELYQQHERLDSAAAALLAARAATPDDEDLTVQAAEMLRQAGRASEAAEFDALLLEANPFRQPVFGRHSKFLEESGDFQALAALMLARAGRLTGAEASEAYLAAADAFRRAGAKERALLSEDQAFESDPSNSVAFELLRQRRQGDVRQLSELLAARARAVPNEAVALLRERAQGLSQAGESLLAADALDELLAVASDDAAALITRAELAAAAGGPLAAQPYDRRLLRLENVPTVARLKAQLRVGHAALTAGAFHDAGDAFEAVVALDPEGERGREALSLLAEVHAKTRNAEGLLKTTLSLARAARPDEAEALYRRAADLFDDPKQVIEALIPLAKLRPADGRVVDRAVIGLQALGRYGDAIDLYERSAEATGGREAAERLLAAAKLVEGELRDEGKARELRERAGRAAPEHEGALRALLADHRRQGNRVALREALQRLLQAPAEADETALWRLELAQAALDDGDDVLARSTLESVVNQGPTGSGYADALTALQPILERQGDDAALGKLLAARAELTSIESRAAMLLESARSFDRAGDSARAAELCRASLSSRPNADALLLLARLCGKLGQTSKAATALVQAAQLSPEDSRGPLLLQAIEAWERAGDKGEARDLLDRLIQEHPNALPVRELTALASRLEAKALASRIGYETLLNAGELIEALKLADEAQDRGRALRALWQIAGKQIAPEYARRIASELRKDSDWDGLLKLAGYCENATSTVELAAGLYEELLLSGAPPTLRETAAERLIERNGDSEVLSRVLESMGADSSGRMLELCLVEARRQGGELLMMTLQRAEERFPARRQQLLQELYGLQRAEGLHADAAATLGRLADSEQDPNARAALRIQLGELVHRQLEDRGRAVDAYERALVEDPTSLAAVQALAQLYPVPERADAFIAMTERLVQLAGPNALTAYRAKLLEAYEGKGRKEDAYQLLSQFDETDETLVQRMRLAEELGRTADVLMLSERLTTSVADRSRILQSYLQERLDLAAMKLGEKMLAAQELPAPMQRTLAERLASSEETAAFAAKLWPTVLRESPFDADGWTLYAEALRRSGEAGQSARMDGFGAVLTGAASAAPVLIAGAVTRAKFAPEETVKLKASVVSLDASKMPRLYRTLADALKALGADDVTPALDTLGGAVGYLASPTQLVIGAGALGGFGPAELTYLCALALALGPAGASLAQRDLPSGFAAAAVAAFDAVPSPLAAGRVLATLEGAEGMTEIAAVARRSDAFRAVVERALVKA
ncbi:MAG: flagellar hook-length control protein FliK [Myxococcaceae bacterium]